jgi:5'-nucleotidase
MQLARTRSVSALLSLAVGAGVLAGAGTGASPAAAEGAAPTGAYVLNTTSIWAAQTVQLTQTSLTDDADPAESVTRVVEWGDGTSEELPAGTSKLRHTYTKTGTFAVSVHLADTEGNAAEGTFPGAAAVKVAATPGTFKLDRTIGYVWTNDEAPKPEDREGWAKVTVSLAAIPANVTRVRIDWGNDDFVLLPRTQKTASYYYQRGTYKLTAAMENADGRSVAKAIGTLKVVRDTYKPTVTVKTPKKPTKASSWKTITGTAADKGLGVVRVEVWVWQKRGSTWYYYNFTKKRWVTYKGGNLPTAAIAVPKLSKGAWKVSVAGIKKGTLEVNSVVADGNWNWSPVRVKTQKIK